VGRRNYTGRVGSWCAVCRLSAQGDDCVKSFRFIWSGRADLNRGPPAPKAGASRPIANKELIYTSSYFDYLRRKYEFLTVHQRTFLSNVTPSTVESYKQSLNWLQSSDPTEAELVLPRYVRSTVITKRMSSSRKMRLERTAST
jgi:hypothetical protein